MTSTSTHDSDRTNTDALREVWTMAHDLVTSGEAASVILLLFRAYEWGRLLSMRAETDLVPDDVFLKAVGTGPDPYGFDLEGTRKQPCVILETERAAEWRRLRRASD